MMAKVCSFSDFDHAACAENCLRRKHLCLKKSSDGWKS